MSGPCRICPLDHSLAINMRSIKFADNDPRKKLQSEFNDLFKYYMIFQMHIMFRKVDIKDKDKPLNKLKQFVHKHREFRNQMPVPSKLYKDFGYNPQGNFSERIVLRLI